jgi:hypothetical protein
MHTAERAPYLVLLQAGKVLLEELVQLLADLADVDRVIERASFLQGIGVGGAGE